MPRPLTAFSPELLEFFRRAATEELRIPVESRARAHAHRHRLHRLRVAMRKEKHYMLSLAEQVTIHIEENEDGTATLIARPSDQDLAAVLREGGITPPELESPTPALTPAPESPSDPSNSKVTPLDQFLHKDKPGDVKP